MSFEDKESKMSRKAKKQLIENAVSEVENIQIFGETMRKQIKTIKEDMIEEIKESNRRKISDEAYIATRRSELIKQMRDAAMARDLAEMQRIKRLLETDNFQS